MNKNFDGLFKEVIKKNYIINLDGEIYLPSKNEIKLREKGFIIDDNIREQLIREYRLNKKTIEKTEIATKKNKWKKVPYLFFLLVFLIIGSNIWSWNISFSLSFIIFTLSISMIYFCWDKLRTK